MLDMLLNFYSLRCLVTPPQVAWHKALVRNLFGEDPASQPP